VAGDGREEAQRQPPAGEEESIGGEPRGPPVPIVERMDRDDRDVDDRGEERGGRLRGRPEVGLELRELGGDPGRLEVLLRRREDRLAADRRRPADDDAVEQGELADRPARNLVPGDELVEPAVRRVPAEALVRAPGLQGVRCEEPLRREVTERLGDLGIASPTPARELVAMAGDDLNRLALVRRSGANELEVAANIVSQVCLVPRRGRSS
jgi:hypothetical protein